MKIGVLTYHSACNFGANLQALSTVSYFIDRGYDVLVIDWKTTELDDYYRRITPQIQYEVHKNFCEKYLPLTRTCATDIDIAKVIEEEKIDAVVIGSDAVMQHHPFLSRIVFPTKKIVQIRQIGRDRLCPNPFWGSFLTKLDRNIPLCFMSGSSQNSAYNLMTKKEIQTMNSCLENFKYVSVRDDWTAKMVNYVSKGKINPPITPDPVFAFNYNVKIQPAEIDIRKKFSLNGKYCLFSFHNSKTVSEKWLLQIEKLFSKANIECIAFPFPSGVKFKHPFMREINVPLDPLEWYSLIKYSSGYIGHNMHPIVVSLHNCVPCFSFDNYGTAKFRFFVNEKSSKIYHILEYFELLSNRVCCHHFAKMPNPDVVFDRIMSFDRKLVAKKRDTLLSSYKKMMMDIEAALEG